MIIVSKKKVRKNPYNIIFPKIKKCELSRNVVAYIGTIGIVRKKYVALKRYRGLANWIFFRLRMEVYDDVCR